MKNIYFFIAVVVTILIIFSLRYSFHIINDSTLRIIMPTLLIVVLWLRKVFKIDFSK